MREGKYAFSEEINENAIIDLGGDGKILAIEILDVSRILGQELLQKILAADEAPSHVNYSPINCGLPRSNSSICRMTLRVKEESLS